MPRRWLRSPSIIKEGGWERVPGKPRYVIGGRHGLLAHADTVVRARYPLETGHHSEGSVCPRVTVGLDLQAYTTKGLKWLHSPPHTPGAMTFFTGSSARTVIRRSLFPTQQTHAFHPSV